MAPTSPGKSWNFAEISGRPGKVLEFFYGQTVQKRDFEIPQHVESNSSLTNCYNFHLRYIRFNNV